MFNNGVARRFCNASVRGDQAAELATPIVQVKWNGLLRDYHGLAEFDTAVSAKVLMPSSLKSFEEFDRLLEVTRAELNALCVAEPDDRALDSVQRQLQALHEWTRGGRIPVQAEKDRLNFGAIASRELDNFAVANSLYELASFVIYWGESANRSE